MQFRLPWSRNRTAAAAAVAEDAIPAERPAGWPAPPQELHTLADLVEAGRLLGRRLYDMSADPVYEALVRIVEEDGVPYSGPTVHDVVANHLVHCQALNAIVLDADAKGGLQVPPHEALSRVVAAAGATAALVEALDTMFEDPEYRMLLEHGLARGILWDGKEHLEPELTQARDLAARADLWSESAKQRSLPGHLVYQGARRVKAAPQLV